MNDPVNSKIRRLSELPRDIPPPHDGWTALEARLRASAVSQVESEAGGATRLSRRGAGGHR